MADRKRKGNLAELKVAADLASRGCEIAIPFGENCSYDLIADFTPAMVDWIAAYDMTTDRCFYVPSWMLGVDGAVRYSYV